MIVIAKTEVFETEPEVRVDTIYEVFDDAGNRLIKGYINGNDWPPPKAVEVLTEKFGVAPEFCT